MRRAACFLVVLAAFGEQLPIHTYTTADGLAGNIIDRIVRDSRGYLWFCTREGLSRFDGFQFKNFGPEQGLPVPVSDLIETRDHDFWIATADGVARLRATDASPHFEIYRPANAHTHSVQVLAADPDGGIWVGTASGLYHLDPPNPPGALAWRLRLVDVGLPNQNFDDASVEALLVDHTRALWVGTRGGLFRRFPDGRHEGISSGSAQQVTALLEGSPGKLLVGTWHGVCGVSTAMRLNGKRLADVCLRDRGMPGGVINSLYESSDGVIWAASTGILSALRPQDENGGWVQYSSRNGLPGEGTPILSIAEDLSGNLWAGGFGAIRIARGGLRTYTEEDGLDSNLIYSIFEDRSGEVCVVSGSPRGMIVHRFDGNRFQALRPNVPRDVPGTWGTGQVTFQARSGEWWVPTGMGLYRFPPISDARQLAQTPPRALYEANNRIYLVFEDSRGGIWMSIEVLASPNGPTRCGGLARWDPATGALRHYSDSDGVSSGNLASAFAEDQTRAVWIGLSTGDLLRYTDGEFQTVRAPNGRRAWVRALHCDRRGGLWIANSQGVTRIDPTATARHPVTYTVADGLATNDVKCVVEDLQGRIYLATGHGVDRLSISSGGLRVRHYTTADGLAPGELRAAFCDRKGTLWFGTREGISRLDPAPEPDISPPAVFVSGLRVRGAPQPVSALGENDLRGLELAPDQNQIEIEFVSPGFEAGETPRYQYRLESRDLDWSAPTERRIVSYASLPAGGYHWQVRAITADGVAGAPANVAFTISAPIWHRWWLRLTMFLLGCAALSGWYRLRVARLLEVERLRTRIATDLHDDIGSTLSQIAILSEVAQRHPDGKTGQNPLESIASLSREMVDSMSDIVWAIDPERDSLEDLAHRMRRFASDLFTHNGVHLSFEAPVAGRNPVIDADVRRQVFLVFKECLNNAVRHSGCHEVKIGLESCDGWLRLSITDDGRGFEAERIRPGHGLASIERRARQLDGSLAVDSAPQRGTSILLKVPLSRKRIPHRWIGLRWPFWRMLNGRE